MTRDFTYDDNSLSLAVAPLTEHMMGKHDQSTHGNKYGTDDKGNRVLTYKGGSGGKNKTNTIAKSIASFKDTLDGKSPQEKEAFLLANGGQAWINNLTPAQQKALNIYTGSSYEEINEATHEALRKGKPMGKTMQTVTDRASEALLNNAAPVSMTVLRGVGHDIVHLFEPGKTFTDKGFMSSSVGKGFKGYKLTLQLPKGTPGGYIATISNYKHENEWLLPPNASFRVISKDANGATLHYLGQSQ